CFRQRGRTGAADRRRAVTRRYDQRRLAGRKRRRDVQSGKSCERAPPVGLVCFEEQWMISSLNRDRVIAFLMLLPSIVLVAIFVYGFIGWTGWTSLTNSNALQQLSGQPAQFVGLQNYTELFAGMLN